MVLSKTFSLFKELVRKRKGAAMKPFPFIVFLEGETFKHSHQLFQTYGYG